MNWTNFVNGEEHVVQKKGHNFYLDQVMAEILENNTLANWVRETNEKVVRHY
ncbi:MAG: hypothetical protein WCW13_03650 [archaeon]|jgi:hypothetical protein